jgi:uncharacterized protein
MKNQNTNTELPFALITGASAGIGKSFANEMAKAGYNVVLVARRENKLEEIAKVLNTEYGVKVVVIAADLSNALEPQRIYDELQEQGINIEVLVNSAGLALAQPFAGSEWEGQYSLLNVMVVSLTHMCHLFAPIMKEQGRGHIINVASMAAYTPELPGNLYNAAKSYVVHMSEALDLELKQSGVNCLALCPGLTRSEFHETMGIKEALDFLPKWRWMDADKVAEEGLKAVLDGQHVLINGKVNKVLVGAFKLMPQKAKYFLGAKGLIL